MNRSYVAIVLAAIAQWVLGAAWFTAFGKQWLAGVRLTDAEIAAMQQHPSPWPYVITFICNLFAAAALLWVMRHVGDGSVGSGTKTGLMLGACLSATAIITEFVFEARIPMFTLVCAAYPVVGTAIMGAIIAAVAGKQWTPRTSSARA